MPNKSQIILILILILGALLRFINLGSLPFPINGDEAAHGYNAWSIGNFGTDEYGEKFPLYFSSAGDYKYPVYNYLSVPVVKIFGLNDFSTRFLSALSGFLFIIVIYKLTQLLIKNTNTALIAALFAAISPWSLIYSRTASLSNTALFFTTAGIYFLLRALSGPKKSLSFFLSAFLMFILSIFTHQSARIFIPGFLILLSVFILINRRRTEFAANYLKLVVFSAVFILITGLSLIPWESRARAEGLSVFSNSSERDNYIAESIREMGLGNPLPPVITRLFFNKLSVLSWEIGDRYLQHFSPGYLFTRGDIVQLNSVPNMGVLYLADAFFLLLGVALFLIRPSFPKTVLLFIILAGPLPAAASIETPSAQRQLIGLSGFLITAAVGLSFLLQKIRELKLKKIAAGGIIGGVILIYCYLFGFFMVNFFKVKPVHKPWSSDQGYQEMVRVVWQEKNNFERVLITQDPYIHFLYQLQIPPGEFLARSEIIPTSKQQWDRIDRLDNIYFKMPVNCPKIGREDVLYVCRGVDIPRNAKILKVIRYGDELPVFTLLKFIPMKPQDQGKDPLPFMLNYMVEGDTRYPEGVFPKQENRYY